ncbi:MAG: ARMT1-like domain-containing protein [Nitrospirota bacterium]|nr:ARMT1-like domain-containing protein [Nitrospirota bacterium]
MDTKIECFPCFLKQVVIALQQLPGGAPDLHQRIFRDVLAIMQKADMSRPPAYTTTFIHRAVRNILGLDPFKKIKYDYNNLAMGLYPELKKKIATSKDPLWTASRLAIAGNVIDFGIFTSIDMEGSINRALEASIAVDDYVSFRKAVGEADNILYLLDNSGEIVFDRLLIEELVLQAGRVTAVVKGSPVLNDVTFEDAVQVDLPEVCEVISNGSDAIGTIMEWTSPGFQESFGMSDLIISKGQGNFETLTSDGKKTYHLFQSKCDVLSKELGLPPGAMLLKKS